jgi:hypothetical protein
VLGLSVPAARAYAGGHPASIVTTWAKVCRRTRLRTPAHGGIVRIRTPVVVPS